MSNQVITKYNFPYGQPVWNKPCPGGCDDWICEAHRLHVYECPWPPYEDILGTGWDPYNGEIYILED